jgi:hypothetical protein
VLLAIGWHKGAIIAIASRKVKIFPEIGGAIDARRPRRFQ